MPVKPFVARVRARFQDTDVMGHVHHAAFLIYLEEARFEFLRAVYAEPGPIPRFVMARVEVDYVKQVFFGDVVEVELVVSRFGNASFDFDCRIRRERDGEIVGRAKTTQVFFDFETGKSAPIDATFRKRVEELQGEIGPLP